MLKQIKYMKKMILVAFLLLLIPIQALAQSFDYCDSNSTLTHVKTVYINVTETGLTRTMNVVENENCPFGCFQDECRQAPYMMILIVLGIIVVIVFAYVILRGVFK